VNGVAATAFAIFLAIAVGLVSACRRWARDAEAEHAETVLRSEIDDLIDEPIEKPIDQPIENNKE
jgi:hypothetical protein